MFSLFPIEKPKLPNLTLTLNSSRSLHGHHLKKNYDGLESLMLHTKFRENRHAGSGEDFRRVFTIYGHGGQLGHVTSIMLISFHFLVPKSFHT